MDGDDPVDHEQADVWMDTLVSRAMEFGAKSRDEAVKYLLKNRHLIPAHCGITGAKLADMKISTALGRDNKVRSIFFDCMENHHASTDMMKQAREIMGVKDNMVCYFYMFLLCIFSQVCDVKGCIVAIV